MLRAQESLRDREGVAAHMICGGMPRNPILAALASKTGPDRARLYGASHYIDSCRRDRRAAESRRQQQLEWRIWRVAETAGIATIGMQFFPTDFRA
jgi:hypothetical protein